VSRNRHNQLRVEQKTTFIRTITSALSIFLCFMVFHACKSLLPTKILPYSMVQYQKEKFVDKTEITVEQWAEFVFDGNLDRKPKEEISEQFLSHEVFYPTEKPDSLYRALGKIDYYELPVGFTYFDTLRYVELREILDFPITGITHDDALAYCAWRTSRYNDTNTDHTKQTIEFVLPDAVVYETVYPLNEKKYEETPIHRVNSRSSSLVNGFQVFGLQSNVAEMTATKGNIYGAPDILNLSTADDAPHQYIGFRCAGLVKD